MIMMRKAPQRRTNSRKLDSLESRKNILKNSSAIFFLCLLSTSITPAISGDYANFDNLNVPITVQKQLEEARTPTAFGYPNFKRVTYVYASEIDIRGKKKELIDKVVIMADKGLIRKRQDFSPFGVDYLAGFGGMVLFKSRGFGPFADNSVSVADNMQLTIPTSPLEIGSKIEISYDMINIPKRPTVPRIHISETCEATKVLGAEVIFSSLTGRAVDMICSGSNATSKNYTHYMTYLEDLGLVVQASLASNPNAVVTRFVSFDIEK